MLYYGAEAQKTFGTDGIGLDTDGLKEEYVNLHTTGEIVVEEENTAARPGVKNQLYQYALGLEDEVNIQFLFYVKSKVYSEYTIKITYEGTVYEYTEEAFTMKQGNFIGFTFNGLSAADMRDTLTVELWQNGARVSDVYTTSIAGTSKGLDAKYAELAVEMMKYGDSAKVYFG